MTKARMLASSFPFGLMWLFGNLFIAIAGCRMDFDPASFVEQPRLVGVRAQVVGDADRATPLPGERVRLEAWLLQPAMPIEVRVSVSICVGLDVRRGPSRCRGQPFWSALIPSSAEGLEAFEITVPNADVLQGASSLLFTFVLCRGPSNPRPLLSGPLCEDPQIQGEIATFSLPIAYDPLSFNRNPSLDAMEVSIQEMAWLPAGETPPSDCRAVAGTPDLPLLVVPSSQSPIAFRILFSVPESARERLPFPPEETRFESLLFSHYTTHGRLKRSFSAIDGLNSRPIEIEWEAPPQSSLRPQGTRVRFTWVARDLRGGFGRSDRFLCLVPEEAMR
ncbi:MAG: hypothetical protein NZM37_07290 [Sandaracinaceae bacterium]|nr:hypothetical protein [Sandaracinaceae bacterium]